MSEDKSWIIEKKVIRLAVQFNDVERELIRLYQQEEELKHIKTELLAWAGLHRGKAISEEAMPRFHEIIDQLDV